VMVTVPPERAMPTVGRVDGSDGAEGLQRDRIAGVIDQNSGSIGL
jgi:hypothetical protein